MPPSLTCRSAAFCTGWCAILLHSLRSTVQWPSARGRWLSQVSVLRLAQPGQVQKLSLHTSPIARRFFASGVLTLQRRCFPDASHSELSTALSLSCLGEPPGKPTCWRSGHHIVEPDQEPVRVWDRAALATLAEFHILEILGCELATPTPAAWVEIFRRRLSLWQQQQLLRPPDVLAVLPLQYGLHGQSSRMVCFHCIVDAVGHFLQCSERASAAGHCSFRPARMARSTSFFVLLPQLRCSRLCAWHFLAVLLLLICPPLQTWCFEFTSSKIHRVAKQKSNNGISLFRNSTSPFFNGVALRAQTCFCDAVHGTEFLT